MNIINIVRPNMDNLVVPITSKAIHYQSLMEHDYIELNWVAEGFECLPVGSTIQYTSNSVTETYTLLEPYTPDRKDEVYSEYSPKFYHEVFTWSKYPFFHYTTTDGTITSREPSWSLTGGASYFATELEAAILNETGATWTVETLSDTDTEEYDESSVSLSFDNVDIISGLNSIADAFGTEWWVDRANKTIHLSRAKFTTNDEIVALEVGVNVSKPSITKSDEEYYNRFYAFGSTRNIVQEQAAATTQLTTDKRLPLNPTTYPNGYYDLPEESDDAPRFSKVVYFEDVYPHANLEISSLICVKKIREDSNGDDIVLYYDGTTPVYDYHAVWYMDIMDSDTGDPFDFNNTTYDADTNTSGNLLSGYTPSVSFKSGSLQGREFELCYIEAATRTTDEESGETVTVPAGYWRIEYEEESGYIIPSIDTLCPAVADTLTIFNIHMPDSYVQTAYTELEEALGGYIEDYNADCTTYEVSTLASTWQGSSIELEIGSAVTLDKTLYGGTLETRVTKIETNLDFPFLKTLTVGNKRTEGTIASLKDTIQSAEAQITDLKKVSTNTATSVKAYPRRFTDVYETMTMLENTIEGLDGYTDSLSPITLQTMQTIVGDTSLQYRFVDNTTDCNTVTWAPDWDTTYLQLECPAGVIQHMTYGISTITTSGALASSNYYCWEISSTTLVPSDADTAYYLYLMVSKSVDEDLNGTGQFILSADSHSFDEGTTTDEYYLLCGILNSQQSDGTRSFSKMYGYTEVLPGQISTDVIQSTYGDCGFDLSQGLIWGDITFGARDTGTSASSVVTAVEEVTDAVQVGGVNLILDSYPDANFTTYSQGAHTLSTTGLKPNTTYTLSVCGYSTSETDYLRVWLYIQNWASMTGWSAKYVNITTLNTNTTGSVTFTTPEAMTEDTVIIVNAHGTVSDEAATKHITWMKLEEGKLATAWTAAPEDWTAAVEAAQEAADEAADAASKAKTAADAATATLGEYASDNYIVATEKTGLAQQYEEILAEYDGILKEAVLYELTSDTTYDAYRNAYLAAVATLAFLTDSDTWSTSIYIVGDLKDSDNNYVTYTDLDGNTVNCTYSDIAAYYTARQALLDKIAAATEDKAQEAYDEAAAATTKLANMKIGGTNLLTGLTKDEEYSGTFSGSSYITIKQWTLAAADLTLGTYILSFEAKSTVDSDKLYTYFYNSSSNNTTSSETSQGIIATRDNNDGQAIFTLSTEWTSYWVIWLQPENAGITKNVLFRLDGNVGSGTVSVRNPKFEYGNIPTAWSYSNADVQSQANALLEEYAADDVISPLEKQGLKDKLAEIEKEYTGNCDDADTYGVSKTAYASAYTLAVEALNYYTATDTWDDCIAIVTTTGTQYYYGYIAAYYEARTALLSAINAAAQASIAGGGVNLILDSYQDMDFTSYYGIGTLSLSTTGLKPSTAYTFSACGYSTSDTDYMRAFVYASDWSWQYSFTFSNIDEEATMNVTFTTPSTITESDVVYVGLRGTLTSGGVTKHITWMKLEEGSVATRWTAAPEDIQSQIEAVEESVTDYEYLKEMLADGSTTTDISDGLVLTNIMGIKNQDSTDGAVVAGIDGSSEAMAGNKPMIFAGADSYQDNTSAPFQVDVNGNVRMTQATLTEDDSTHSTTIDNGTIMMADEDGYYINITSEESIGSPLTAAQNGNTESVTLTTTATGGTSSPNKTLTSGTSTTLSVSLSIYRFSKAGTVTLTSSSVPSSVTWQILNVYDSSYGATYSITAASLTLFIGSKSVATYKKTSTTTISGSASNTVYSTSISQSGSTVTSETPVESGTMITLSGTVTMTATVSSLTTVTLGYGVKISSISLPFVSTTFTNLLCPDGFLYQANAARYFSMGVSNTSYFVLARNSTKGIALTTNGLMQAVWSSETATGTPTLYRMNPLIAILHVTWSNSEPSASKLYNPYGYSFAADLYATGMVKITHNIGHTKYTIQGSAFPQSTTANYHPGYLYMNYRATTYFYCSINDDASSNNDFDFIVHIFDYSTY